MREAVALIFLHSLQCLTEHHMQNISQWERRFWVGTPTPFPPDHHVHLSWNRHIEILNSVSFSSPYEADLTVELIAYLCWDKVRCVELKVCNVVAKIAQHTAASLNIHKNGKNSKKSRSFWQHVCWNHTYFFTKKFFSDIMKFNPGELGFRW